MAYLIRDLRKCNGTLFGDPARLIKLPTAELGGYMRKCFGAGAATKCARRVDRPHPFIFDEIHGTCNL